jgi:hypothetical protein
MRILTDVSATVDPARETDLINGFHHLLTEDLPDGLLRTELLRGADGQWRIQSLWRDRASLEAMRAAAEPPAAPRLFREVGAEPSLQVLDVAVALTEPEP